MSNEIHTVQIRPLFCADSAMANALEEYERNEASALGVMHRWDASECDYSSDESSDELRAEIDLPLTAVFSQVDAYMVRQGI